jgi:hypothetical protein
MTHRNTLLNVWKHRNEAHTRVLASKYYAHTRQITDLAKIQKEVAQYSAYVVTDSARQDNNVSQDSQNVFKNAIHASRLLAFVQDVGPSNSWGGDFLDAVEYMYQTIFSVPPQRTDDHSGAKDHVPNVCPRNLAQLPCQIRQLKYFTEQVIRFSDEYIDARKDEVLHGDEDEARDQCIECYIRLINHKRQWMCLLTRLHVLTFPISIYSAGDVRILTEYTRLGKLYPVDPLTLDDFTAWHPSLLMVMPYFNKGLEPGPLITWEKNNPIDPCDTDGSFTSYRGAGTVSRMQQRRTHYSLEQYIQQTGPIQFAGEEDPYEHSDEDTTHQWECARHRHNTPQAALYKNPRTYPRKADPDFQPDNTVPPTYVFDQDISVPLVKTEDVFMHMMQVHDNGEDDQTSQLGAETVDESETLVDSQDETLSESNADLTQLKQLRDAISHAHSDLEAAYIAHDQKEQPVPDAYYTLLYNTKNNLLQVYTLNKHDSTPSKFQDEKQRYLTVMKCGNMPSTLQTLLLTVRL